MNFNDYAKTWDSEIRINRAATIANEISSSICINENLSAMEFGCGTGLVSFNLYDRFKSITLVDSSKGMIDILNSKIAKYEVTNMVAYNLDLSINSSLDIKYDVIYNSMVLHHIHDIISITKKFNKLLNKDGYLCVVDLDEEDGSFHKNEHEFDGHNGFNQVDLKQILVNSGFKDVESNTFYYDEKTIDGEKIKYSLFLMKARK
jgi:ubiquinone/menaquinone biosynthesis C-methylase UbiE